MNEILTREIMYKAIKKLKKYRELNYMIVFNMNLNKNLLKEHSNWKKERLKEKYQVETVDD